MKHAAIITRNYVIRRLFNDKIVESVSNDTK